MARPRGLLMVAAVAAAPSPVELAVPVPAYREMVATLVTLRTLLPLNSAMNRLLLASTRTACGELIVADVPAPPSPVELPVPVPTHVEMFPEVSTLRMRWLPESAMKA